MSTTKRTMKTATAPPSATGLAAPAQLLPLPPNWLETVKLEMMRRNWSNRDLASNIGRSNATITRFFQGKTSERIATQIAKALELPHPATGVAFGEFSDAVRKEWAEIGARLHAVDPQRFERVKQACLDYLAVERAAEKMFAALRP